MTGYIVAEFDSDGEMVYMKFWDNNVDALADLSGPCNSTYCTRKAKWEIQYETV